MRPSVWVLSLTAALALSACSGLQVETDFDSEASQRFPAYRTYSWLPEPVGGDTRVHNAIVGGRVRRAVDAALRAKGYAPSPGSPDFHVGWHANIEGKIDIHTVNTYYGYGYGGTFGHPGWPGGVLTQTTVREYEQGTLILDIVDAASQQLVWRGTASAELRPGTRPEERDERVRNAVNRILERFPPE